MKEAVIALIGAVIGFGLGLCRELWIEKRQREKEERRRIATLLSVIRDAKAVIEKNGALPRKGEGRQESPLSHKADVWRSMINTGGMDFLESKILHSLREIWVVLGTADGYVTQISAVAPQLASANSSVKGKAQDRINALKGKLRELYKDNEILAKLLQAEEMVEAESREPLAEESEERQDKLVRERMHPKAEDIPRTAGELREGMK